MFDELDTPEDLCIVLLSRKGWTHCGVWLRGKIAHLTRAGVKHEPLARARVGFNSVRFFKCV